MTDFNARAQALTCLYLFLSGVMSAVLYDLLTPLRRRSRVLCALSDLLFCALAAAACAVSLAAGGADSARPYAFFMLFLGLFFWRLAVRRPFLWFLGKIGRKKQIRGEMDKKQTS